MIVTWNSIRELGQCKTLRSNPTSGKLHAKACFDVVKMNDHNVTL